MIYLITGTSTDVGKTIATAALACLFQGVTSDVHVVKPAQTGEAEGVGDVWTVGKLAKLPRTHLHEYTRYPDPLAPLTAARHVDMAPLSLKHTAAQVQSLGANGTVLVEGAGGLLVELGENSHGTPWTLADLAVRLDAPVIVVTSTGLGSLNHATLTLDALRTRGIPCAGLIGGSVSADADLATRLNLEHFQRGPAPWLGALPSGAGSLTPDEFSQVARASLQLPNPTE